jgi:hypothetical protein
MKASNLPHKALCATFTLHRQQAAQRAGKPFPDLAEQTSVLWIAMQLAPMEQRLHLHAHLSPKAMDRSFFAVLTDPYSAGSISIHSSLEEAEQERSHLGEQGSIARFRAPDLLLAGPEELPIHMAYTLEDDGIRIHGVFNSLFSLQTYLREHYCEAPCHHALVRNGNACMVPVSARRA